MNSAKQLHEKRHLMRYLDGVTSKFDSEGQAELILAFSIDERRGRFDTTDLLLLQRVILRLKGNPVLAIALGYANSIRPNSRGRTDYRSCIVSGL